MRGFSCVFKFSREYLTTSSIRSELKPWVLARLDSGVCQYWTALYQIIQKFSLLNSRSLCLNYIYTHMNIFLLLVFGYVLFSRCFQVERVCRLCLNYYFFFFNLIWQVELRSLGFCTWVEQLKRGGQTLWEAACSWPQLHALDCQLWVVRVLWQGKACVCV